MTPITPATPIGEVLPPETIAALARIMEARKTGTVKFDLHLGMVKGGRYQAPEVALR